MTLKFLVPLIFLTMVLIGVSALTLGILAPVATAGYMQALLHLLREGRQPEIRDIFSQMRLFFPLLAFSAGVAAITVLGYALLIVPGVFISLALLFACLYVYPLMTDRHMGLLDAIRESWTMSTRGNLTDQFMAVIIIAGLVTVGGSLLIAALFTIPLATIFLLCTHEEKRR